MRNVISVIVPLDSIRINNYNTILSAYQEQLCTGDEIIFVLDRVNAPKIINSKITQKFYNSNVKRDGFFAGHCRDIGLSKSSGDTVIFTDGDCIPSSNFVKKISECSHGGIVYALRKMYNSNGDTQLDVFDHRVEYFRNFNVKLPDEQSSIFNSVSCAIGINRENLNSIIDFNNKLALKLEIRGLLKLEKNRLFNSYFDGFWGGEDNFVGHIAWMLGIPVYLLADDSFVMHLEHKSSYDSAKYQIETYFNKMSNLINLSKELM